MRRASLIALCALLPAQLLAQVPAAKPAATPAPQIAVERTIADEQIEERLRAVISTIEDLKNVTVEVESGVVRLGGAAIRARAREKVEQLATRFEGVVYVENKIEDETAIESRITPAINKIQQYVNGAIRLGPVIAVALCVVLLFWGIGRLFSHWDAPFNRIGIKPLVRELIQRLVGSIALILGIVIALDILDATAMASALLGMAGLAGLAIGFAFRDIVENYLAGVILSFRHPFSIGDHLLIDTREGRVIRLTAREMVLMTLDGNHLSIPNATVFKSIVCNYTRNPRRRFDVAIGISTEEDLAEVQALGKRALAGMKGLMADPAPFVRIEALGESSVTVKFYGWVDQREADFLKVRSEAVRIVKAALDAADIEMPEPIHRVVLQRLKNARKSGDENPSAALEAPVGQANVEVDSTLDSQIREDLAVSDEENLLDPEK